MRTTTEPGTRLATAALAISAILTLLLGIGAPASAAQPEVTPAAEQIEPSSDVGPLASHCNASMCFRTSTGAASNDAGGRWAYTSMWLLGRSQYVYSANFIPRGETLVLADAEPNDDLSLRAYLTIRDRSGRIVDRDLFETHWYASYNLGTPDGSGDIPEGYRVTVEICWGINCSTPIDGVA